MRQLERMEDRYSGVHPLLGVELRDVEDEEGIQAEEANFQDIIAHKSEGVWRDATFANIDWAYAPPMSNIRPRATLIHCGNSLNKSPGAFDDFANRINAPIIRLPSYFPYISGTLSAILDALESR